MEYGVIGSPLGSGPSSLGSSPGTPAAEGCGFESRLVSPEGASGSSTGRATANGRRGFESCPAREISTVAQQEERPSGPLSSMAERRFRKAEAAGSVPAEGSTGGTNQGAVASHRGTGRLRFPPVHLSGWRNGSRAALRSLCPERGVRVQVPPRVLCRRAQPRPGSCKAGGPG